MCLYKQRCTIAVGRQCILHPYCTILWIVLSVEKKIHQFFELDLQTTTEPGFSIRRTVSSVIGSISGLMLLDSSADPLTCSRWILISVFYDQPSGVEEC